MPLEIEAKMRLADPAALAARLRELGAERGPVIDEINCFHDTPDHALKRAGQGLRIRVERRDDQPQPQVIITHKGPQAPGRLKTRPETQLHVDNAEDAAALLEALGYVRILSFEKRRRRWYLDGCNVELDSLPELGDFVEIEGPGEDVVMAVRTKLGLANEALIRESYAALVAAARS